VVLLGEVVNWVVLGIVVRIVVRIGTAVVERASYETGNKRFINM